MSAPAHTPRLDARVSVPQGLRRIAILPAHNEEASIAGVIAEIRETDPDFQIVVVDDGSTDRTAEAARAAGAIVLRLPYNLGIGGAVQTGLQYAREHGFDIAVQVDADGQHDPAEIEKLLGPLLESDADVVIGSRFTGEGNYRAGVVRRAGMVVFAGLVSFFVGQRLSDTSSSFRAYRRRAIALYAHDYPHGFLETVEATVMGRRAGLRFAEVPVVMRVRFSGSSSLTLPVSIYYSAKVLVALFVGMFRRSDYRLEDD
jgi:glycosyltransferase involved in cell wall biosynthesis